MNRNSWILLTLGPLMTAAGLIMTVIVTTSDTIRPAAICGAESAAEYVIVEGKPYKITCEAIEK